MERVTPFITSIWLEEISDQKKLIENIIKIKKEDTGSIQKSNQGGWQSRAYSNNCNSFLVSTIEEVIEKVRIVYSELGINREPLLKNYWFNCNFLNDYNLRHVHAYSFVSVVLYVKVPKNSGNLVFDRPDNFEHFIDGSFVPTEQNVRSFYIVPRDNLLVMFPSYLPHYVEKSNSSEERISIAFNFG